MTLILKLKTILFLSTIIIFIENQAYAQTICNISVTLEQKDELYGLTFNLNYSNYISSCWLKIKSPEDYGIRFDFEHFNVQEKECSSRSNSTISECCDFVELGHGSKLRENIHGIYCGSIQPEPVMFDKKDAWINLHTDKSIKGGGIKIRVKPFRVMFRNTNGHIENSVEKENYLNNLDLTYRINVPDTYIIYFRFQETFSIESFNNTCLDSIEIGTYSFILTGEKKDSNTNSSQALVRYEKMNTFCGHELPDEFYINSNQVYVRFLTDGNITEGGFSLFYRSIKTIFHEPSGNITLDSYALNMSYEIRAPSEHKIELIFEKFSFANCIIKKTTQFEDSPNNVCSLNNDHLEVKF
jgi:hypothetical protein